MPEMTMDQALEAAAQLDAQLDEQALYPELEKAVRAFENDGYPIEAIIPQGTDARLGFSLKTTDGRAFFQVYSKLIRKSLCSPRGEFNKLIKSGLSKASAGAVLTTIVTSLGIPAIALTVIVPVAVIIAKTGLDAFCELTKEEQ
jgi:hypothetical protein